MKNPFKKSARFKDYALMLNGLKKFEEKGLITYNFQNKTALVNSLVFDPLLKMTGLTYEKLAKAAAVKIFLQNSIGKKPEDAYLKDVKISCQLYCSEKGLICEGVVN